jgi:hypothetical protein
MHVIQIKGATIPCCAAAHGHKLACTILTTEFKFNCVHGIVPQEVNY